MSVYVFTVLASFVSKLLLKLKWVQLAKNTCCAASQLCDLGPGLFFRLFTYLFIYLREKTHRERQRERGEKQTPC